MRILKTIIFQGPNRWSRSPVLEVHIESCVPGDSQASRLSRLAHQLHRETGVSIVELHPVATENPSAFLLPFEFEEETLLRECLDTALRLIKAVPNPPIDTTSERQRLIDLADDVRLGPSSRAILRAAIARNIPFHRLNERSLVQLGEGAYQRRICTAETDATSAIAESIASDKQLTRSMLAAIGVNVPQGRTVTDREDAWRAAQEIGLPVVVKPKHGNHAAGVSLDLTDRESVLIAYDWACKAVETSEILVEQHIQGDHHRLLVIGSELVAAAKGQREYVVGNGVQSITELVAELNRDPHRGNNYVDPLDIVSLNESAAIVLKKQRLTFDSIPSLHQKVLVRHVGDLIEDCTHLVHPATHQVAVLAAKVIGLDIAGMDVVATDISRPLSEQRGCIIEVNAGPSLSPHVAPLIGSPQPVGEAVVDLLFPDGNSSKIPIVLVIDEATPFELAERMAISLQKIGFNVGIATDSLSSANEESTTWLLKRKLDEFQSLIMHPYLTAITIECSAAKIASHGLLCSHVEFVIVPDWFSHLTDSMKPRSEIHAALETVRHLLAESGCLIVKSKVPLDLALVEKQTGIPPTRVKIVASDELAIECVCKSVHSLD